MQPVCVYCRESPRVSNRPYCSKDCAVMDGVRQEPGVSGLRQLSGRVEFHDRSLNCETAFLGNFHECLVAGFPCAEALFQAAQFIRPAEPLSSWYNQTLIATFQDIASDGSAGRKAWELGQAFSPRADWETCKMEIMENILRLKYWSHPELRTLLLYTGVSRLVEKTGRYAFWGDGGDCNHLGRLQMKLRDELQTTGRLACPATLEEALLIKAPVSAAAPAATSQGICDWILSIFCGIPKRV